MADSGSVELDLADQRPGHALLAKLAQLHADNPTAGDENLTSWAVGFVGERLVGEHLGCLGDTWRVLHAVPLGRRGKDIDHLVLGPPGLFAINTKHPAGARITVKGRDACYLNGVWKPYLKDARRDARATRDHLLTVVPAAVAVHAVVCTVGAQRTVATPADAVTVLDAEQLVPWLTGHRPVLDPTQVQDVFAHARRPDTWPGTPVLAATDAVADLAERLATIRPTAPVADTNLPHRPPPAPQTGSVGTPPPRRPRRERTRPRSVRPRSGRSRTTARRSTPALIRLGVSIGILAALWLLGPERITALLHPVVTALTKLVSTTGRTRPGP